MRFPHRAIFDLLRKQRLPPRAIIQIPLNRLPDPLAWRMQRLPTQLRPHLRGIDRVPPVVSEPVCHVADQVVRLTERLEDQFNHRDVLHLAVATDVVNLTWPAFQQHRHDAAAMIFHVDPVAHVQSVPIDRQLLVR